MYVFIFYSFFLEGHQSALKQQQNSNGDESLSFYQLNAAAMVGSDGSDGGNMAKRLTKTTLVTIKSIRRNAF